MYHIQIGINISSEAKTDFIVNELIPFLEEHVKDNYYFTRSVNVIPVIDLYLNTSDIKITYIYSKIQSIFDKCLVYISDTHDTAEREEYCHAGLSVVFLPFGDGFIG